MTRQMETLSIALLDDYQGVALTMAAWDRLPAGVTVRSYEDHVPDEEAVVDRLRPYDVVVMMRERTPLSRRAIEALPNLKLVVTTGMRNAALDLAACRKRGIPVCGTEALAAPTAELAWGLILALARGIPAEDRGVRQGRWQLGLGHSLGGKTLGILGLGRLGTQVARVGAAFGMRIAAWSQNLTAERAAAGGAELVERERLFREADVLTVHLVLSERTRGLVGASELALMKPGAYLVNTSRGPIVEEAALVATLRSGAIAGAALDVFDVEPLPAGHPFTTLPNVILTPHLGYVTEENYLLYYTQALEDVERWMAGNPVRLISP